MAEGVEQRLETQVPAFEELISIGAFTEKEVKQIIKKRRSFEYSLTSKLVRIENYMKYIEYEAGVMALTERRKEERGIEESNKRLISDVDWPKHIHSIYRRGLGTFPENIDFWLMYFDFCESRGDNKSLHIAIDDCIKHHSNNIKIWIRAARFEMDKENNIEAAREYMQQAIAINPMEPKLYSVYGECILFQGKQIEERRKIQGMTEESDISLAALKIFEEGLKKCKGQEDKVIKLFVKVFKQYGIQINRLLDQGEEYGKSINEEGEIENKTRILSKIAESYEEDKAIREAYERLIKETKLRELEIKYGEYLGRIGDCKSLLKIVNSIEWFTDNETITFARIFINKGYISDADEMLADGESNEEMRKLRLEIISKESMDFKEFKKKGEEYLNSIGNFRTQNLDGKFLLLGAQKIDGKEAEEWKEFVYQYSNRIDPTIIGKAIEFTKSKFGNGVAIDLMEKVRPIVSGDINYYKSLIKIVESEGGEKEMEEIKRGLYETMVCKFGRENSNVWIDYIEYEMKHNNLKRVESIRRRASGNLKDNSEFSRLYQERFCRQAQ